MNNKITEIAIKLIEKGFFFKKELAVELGITRPTLDKRLSNESNWNILETKWLNFLHNKHFKSNNENTDYLKDELKSLSDNELINYYNFSIKTKSSQTSRNKRIKTLIDQFKLRNINYDLIKKDNYILSTERVILIVKKIYKLSDLSKNQIQIIFDFYLLKNHPDKLKFNPKIISYDDNILKFGMEKHNGILNMETENIILKI